MDTTRGILFLVVTLIIIVSIYYIVKMVKGRTQSRSPLSPSPSSSDQTDKISISDLKFERTLNPDKSNSKGDDGIAGYTIEYSNGINGEGPITSPSGINYKELSENVTFTLSWTNNIGFTGNVKGFNIEHYVSGEDGTYLDSANKSINFETKKTSDTDTTENAVSLDNFGENSVSIVSDGTYSVVGNNRFKISVIMNNNTNKLLYNGLEQTEDGHEIGIGGQDLGATLNMTVPQTVTYTPVTNSFTTSKVDIVINKYWIYNENTNLNIGDEFIYLIPASPGNNKAYDAADKMVDTFYFKYEDGDYLLQDLKKGKWNEKTNKATNANDFETYDNRMFVSFYNKEGNTMELRAVTMGFGVGTHAITTDENGKLELMSLSDTDTIDETKFKNSVWTFVDTKEMKCENDTIRINRLVNDKWNFCKFSLNSAAAVILDCGNTTNSDSSYENASKWKITKVARVEGSEEDGSGYTLTSDYGNTTYYLEARYDGLYQHKIMYITTDETIIKKSDFKDVQSHNKYFCADKYMRIDIIDYISNME
jgi:hypothetical protein